MSKYNKTIRLSLNNDHLMDVFSDHYYIEIGNSEYAYMKKILAYETVRLDDLIDYDIQSMGIGKSEVSNEELARKIPYLFFYGLNEENPSVQVFLTYGLLSYNGAEEEMFAPVLLIPIRLFYEDKYFSLILDGEIIYNELLLNRFRRLGYIISKEKLNTIYDCMRFCMNLAKTTKTILNLENFLTIAKTELPPIVMNHDKFSLNQNIYWPLAHRYFDRRGKVIPFISELNYRQRQTVERAMNDNSFAIIGAAGTGKTRTLLNIAVAKMYEDKKVLYLSAQKRSLDNFANELKSLELSHSFINLAQSPQKINLKAKYKQHLNDEVIVEDVRADLEDLYNTIEDYESLYTKRIKNFRFAEVIEKLITVKKPSEYLEIDNLDNIYKNEYLEIIDALRTIQIDMHKIPVLKESKFINIPFNHQIEYPNQVLTLLFEIHQNLNSLKGIAKKLELEHSFNSIPNYAKFKSIISTIRALEYDKIPQSWIQPSRTNYLKAKKEFSALKQLINMIQEIELYIAWDYNKIENFDIFKATKDILASYWQEDDIVKINKIINNHLDLLSQLRLAVHNNRVFNKATAELKTILDWDFNPEDDEIIAIINSLNEYFKNYRFSCKWIDINKYSQTKKDIIDLVKQIKRYEFLESQYLRYFATIDEIEENIASLREMEAKGKKPAKFKDIVLEDYLKDLEEFKGLIGELPHLLARYKEITDFEYFRNDNIIVQLDACYNFFTSITNDEYRAYITNFFLKLKNNNNKMQYFQTLNTFVHSYTITNDIYEYVINYFDLKKTNKLHKKQKFFEEAYAYINRIYDLNYRMQKIVKESSKFVKFETYLEMRDRFHKLDIIRQDISANKDYPYLFGNLFVADKTNVNELAAVIEIFDEYSKIFTETEALKNSLAKDELLAILALINETDIFFSELTQLFKTYSRLFKDGIGNFYYDDFEITLNYLNSLMNSKDELIAYLDLTHHLQTLHKYKLFLVSNFITSGEEKDFINIFEYYYFTYLYQEFMHENNISDSNIETANILEKLKLLLEKEESYYLSFLQEIKNKNNTTSNAVLSHLSYAYFVLRANRPIYLATPSILNNFLNINYFDIVLIDDAQMLHANDYYLAMQAKQIIVAGEELAHYMNHTTLLSRIRPSNIVNFTQRFYLTPLQLSLQVSSFMSPFYNNYDGNQGIRIVESNIYQVVLSLLENDYNINIYVKSLNTKRKIYENFSSYALNAKIDVDKIESYLSENLVITDLLGGYSRIADINILYLLDYYDLNLEYIDSARLSNLLLPKRELIFYDPTKLLQTNEDYSFISLIKSMIISPIASPRPKDNVIYQTIVNYLTKYGYIPFGSYYGLSILFTKNRAIYSIIIYYDLEKSNNELIETYRTYYKFANQSHLKTYFVFIRDLYVYQEQVIIDIIKDIENEH